MIDRRTFLKGLVATAAGVLVPGAVLAEPERRVWALDRTMVAAERTVVHVQWDADPLRWAYSVNFRYDDGYTDNVMVTAEELHRGEPIQIPRGGTLSGVDITSNWLSRTPLAIVPMSGSIWDNPTYITAENDPWARLNA